MPASVGESRQAHSSALRPPPLVRKPIQRTADSIPNLAVALQARATYGSEPNMRDALERMGA